MRIRQAEEKDMPRIMEIWQEAFGDSQEEIEMFFRSLKKEVRTYVAEEQYSCAEQHICAEQHSPEKNCSPEGKCRIAGQLCVLPALLFSETGKKVPAAYLYAVATAKEFRNKGICTLLLKEIHKILKEENRISFLVPAEEGLLLFYEKRGFLPCFTEELTEVSPKCDTGEDTEKYITPIGAEEYITLRKKAFAGLPHAELSEACLKYALQLHQRAGGSCAKIKVAEKEYGILYKKQADEAFIQEITAAEKKEAEEVAGDLLILLGAETEEGVKRALLRRSYPVCMKEDGGGGFENLYFNLVLD